MLRRGLVGCGLLSLVIWFWLAGHARTAVPHRWFAPRRGDHRPLVMAHQGGEDVWPSNTMFAFEKAAALGVDVLDTDTHLTRDGALVLIHDTTVDRTTDGHGAVRDMTLREVQALDAGYRFSRDGRTFPFRGQGLRIASLEELLARFPGVRIGLEIKQTSPEAIGVLSRLLDRYGAREQVLMSTFEAPMMLRLRRECPDLATSATPGEARLFWILSLLHLEGCYSPDFEALQVPLASSGLAVVSPRFVAAARNRELKVLPWTINAPAEMRECLSLGLEGINTNVPGTLLDMLRGH